MNCHEDIKKSEVEILRKSEDCIIGKFQFPENLMLFQGHFPGNPILPGVFQIEMIKHCLEKVLKISLCLKTVKKTKFSSLIHPGVMVTVEIKINRKKTEMLDVKAVVKAGDISAGKANLILVSDVS